MLGSVALGCRCPYERRTRTAFGCSGFGWLPGARGSTDPPDMCWRSASAICDRALLPCTGTAPAVDDADSAPVDTLAPPSRNDGCSAPPALLQRLAAGEEVDGVVAVAAIRRAASRRHEPTFAEQAQVVGHQALRLVDQHHQLPHGPIALHELSQQPPPQRMRRQPHESWRFVGVRVGQ